MQSVSEKGEHEFSLNKLVKTLTEANQVWIRGANSKISGNSQRHTRSGSVVKITKYQVSYQTITFGSKLMVRILPFLVPVVGGLKSL